MTNEATRSTSRVLDPVSRVSEILFGLIMVLTFTCSISAGEAGREEIRTILIGAISCNIAWGLVDAVMYLMSSITERGRGILTLKALRNAADRQTAERILRDALPPVVGELMEPAELNALREKLNRLPEPPEGARLTKQDWIGAVAVFLLVFLSTFPVVVPFLFMHDALRALRFSNAIAVVMLFLTGYSLGRHAGSHPWKTGLSLVVLGIVLVAITMALGG